MKTLSRDICITLCLKMVLLVLLWYFVIHDKKPSLLSGDVWMLGHKHETSKVEYLNRG